MIELYKNQICLNYYEKKEVISLSFPNVNSLINYLLENQELEQKVLETDYKTFKIYEHQQALNFFRWYFNEEKLDQCIVCHYYTSCPDKKFASITEYLCSNCGHLHYDD